jgi:hypothetical protein
MTKKIFISADHGMAIAGLKPHAQYVEAVATAPRDAFGLKSESARADFHELRQGFSPPNLEACKIILATESTSS